MKHTKNFIFCGEISEISQNTLSKVAQSHFCRENSEISQIYKHDACKIHQFDNFWWRIVGKQASSLWGLVIETSNAQNAMFSFKTQPL